MPLPPHTLRRQCDASSLGFKTTRELDLLDDAIGQDRALEAIRFGVGIRQPGYNMFALGPSGTGKHFVIKQFFDKAAAEQPTPQDWCYVHNFQEPRQPMPLVLPPGRGVKLRAHMESLVEDVRAAISSAFDSEDYRSRRRIVEEMLKERQQEALEILKGEAEKEGVAILSTGSGFALAPMDDEGELLEREAFKNLDREIREVIEATMNVYQEKLEEALRQAPLWEQEQREMIRTLDKELSAHACAPLFRKMRRKYKGLDEVLAWLEELREDMEDHAEELVAHEDDDEEGMEAAMMRRAQRPDVPPVDRRYQINVLIDHGRTKGAPVIYEDWPTVYNLLGRIEHRNTRGALETDFGLIRPGALHRANGGYLVLDAEEVLQQPHTWSQLKRSLRASQIRTGSIEQLLDRATISTLEPQPIPLDVKVVLVGERDIYYELFYADPDFEQLFKVPADFDDEIERTAANEALFARLVATLVKKHKLRALDCHAVAAVIDHASRDVEDHDRLSIHIQTTSDLLREADYCAQTAGHKTVTVEDVQNAISSRRQRSGRARERSSEQLTRGIVLLDTEGFEVGQINGLAVMQLGQGAFGRPSRISASWRAGSGDVVDIEREVDLGGPLHSKGVLIITGFLGSRYAQRKSLPISASIVMEQSYGEVDGDSASLAELCALLSSLSGVPIDQAKAVTGSVNQRGQVQAIGGANEKIEGFFDVCVARGLSGEQGVLIPASNVPHLMLRQDVVEACAEGKFNVWAVSTVDEALEILTGATAGKMTKKGTYPKTSIHGKVQALLDQLSKSQDDD